MAGAVYLGLEYASIPIVLEELRVTARRRPELIADLRLMERAALPLLNARATDDVQP